MKTRRMIHLVTMSLGAMVANSASWAGSACPADISPAGGNGVVDVNDLLLVVGQWGPCPAPPATCAADISPPGGNGVVDVNDLLMVIGAWGLCPCDPSGVWVNNAAPHYQCAFGLVNLNITHWVFSQSATMLNVTAQGVSTISGPMSGPAVNCTAGQSFSVTRTMTGSCTETYTLSGTFNSTNQFTGTFTAVYTGSCFGCINQSWNITATRNP